MNALIPRAVLCAILLCLQSAVSGQEPSPNPPAPDKPAAGGQPPCGPPPEAFKACEGKNAGSRAEFVSPHGDTVQGVCQNDGNGKIVLRPDRALQGAPGGHHQPPPEAYAACTGKSAGAKAQLLSPHGDTITGTCQSDGEKLVLRPDRPPQESEGEKGQQK